MNKKSFTLLELIIVIIIVGVLAALALPQFSRLIEASRGAEAKNMMISLRQHIERYAILHNGNYYSGFPGYLLNKSAGVNLLNIEDPSDAGNSHFNYWVTTNPSGKSYVIVALRNTFENNKVMPGLPSGPVVIALGYGCAPTVNADGSVSYSWRDDGTIYWSFASPYR